MFLYLCCICVVCDPPPPLVATACILLIIAVLILIFKQCSRCRCRTSPSLWFAFITTHYTLNIRVTLCLVISISLGLYRDPSPFAGLSQGKLISSLRYRTTIFIKHSQVKAFLSFCLSLSIIFYDKAYTFSFFVLCILGISCTYLLCRHVFHFGGSLTRLWRLDGVLSV